MTSQELSQRLRQLRRDRGLSQAQLAGRDFDPSYISLIEAGRRTPTEAAAARLAQRLGCSASFLLSGVEEKDAYEADLELRYAQLALESGEVIEASRRFERLLAEAGGGESSQTAAIRWGLARATEERGDIESAAAVYDQLWEEALAESDGELAGRCAVALCRCYRETGDLSRSLEIGERALQRLAEIEAETTVVGIELASTVVGVLYERGDLAAATHWAERTIQRAEQVDSRRARGAAYWNASVVAHERGREPEALRLAERALAMLAERGDERALARLRVVYGSMLARTGPQQSGRGLEQLERARKTLDEAGDSLNVAYCDTEIAVVLHLMGQDAEAIEAAQRSLAQLGANQRLESGRARLALAAALVGTKQADKAQEEMGRAAEELEQAGATRQSAQAWRELGDLLASLGSEKAAHQAFDKALRLLGIGPRLPHLTQPAATRLRSPSTATSHIAGLRP